MSDFLEGVQKQRQGEVKPQQQQQRKIKPLDELEAMKKIDLPTENRFRWCGCPRGSVPCKCDSNYNG